MNEGEQTANSWYYLSMQDHALTLNLNTHVNVFDNI